MYNSTSSSRVLQAVRNDRSRRLNIASPDRSPEAFLSPHPSPLAPRAFTLVELLVVITIIGILIALLLPAVQAAREAARRVQCCNHLKQVGLALHSYTEDWQSFPPGMIPNNPPAAAFDIWAEATTGRHGTSWMLRILPHLEQQSLFDKWDFTKNVVGNAAVAKTDIATFYCPSRRGNVRSEDIPLMFQQWTSGGTDYGACLGAGNNFYDGYGTPTPPCEHSLINRAHCWNDLGNCTAGIFNPYATVGFAQITDGTSNTIMIGEVQRLDGTRLWLPPPEGFQCQSVSHDGWAVGGVSNLFDLQPATGTMNSFHFENPGSEHSGGAHFGLADGSVRFISENTGSEILHYLSTHACDEIIPDEF